MSSIEIHNEVNTVTISEDVATVDIKDTVTQVEVYNGGVGPQGTQGITGTQGTQGTQGTTGIQGAQGIQGLSLQGIQGVLGAQGVQGLQGRQGIQGIQGAQGITGIQGTIGLQGLTGTFGGATFQYNYIAATSDPSPSVNGQLNFNGAINSSTTLYIDYEDAFGSTIYAFLQTIDDSTSSIKGTFKVSELANPVNFVYYSIVGSHFEDTTHFHIPIAFVTGSISSLSNSTPVAITFARNGDIGDQGPRGLQGIQGTQGIQGVGGFQGLQGVIGPVGYNYSYDTTPSSSPNVGDRWVDSNSGIEYTYIDDGDSSQWVEVSASGFVGLQGVQGIQGITGATQTNATTTDDLLNKFFNYPPTGYETFPRYFAIGNNTVTNGQIAFSLFTPLRTVTVNTITTQTNAGRLDYGYTANYRGIGIYQCSGTNNATLTPLAVTWDKDNYLWGISNHGPGTTTTTLTSSVASNSGNYTLVTCTGTGASFASGQRVTVSGGTGGFTSFTGMVVGTPSATSWILQASGTSVVTGTMTGGSATGISLSNSNCTITSGTVSSGTGTVATVGIVHNTMTIPFSPGQWVNVTGSINSFSGVVSESPAPTSTGFTMTAPSTLTSGSVGTGSAVTPDSYGRYVRPLYTPTASGTGVVAPTSITLNANTTYAMGVLLSATGGTFSAVTISCAANTSANQLVLPYQSLGLNSQTTITNASITGTTVVATAPWGRLT